MSDTVRYTDMKDSGIKWIGEIPASWNVRTLYQLVTRVNNKNSDLAEQNLLSLSYGKIKRKDINAKDGLLPASFDGYNIIEAGDIVLRLTDLQNDHTSLRVGQATERGIITSAYTTLRPFNPEYSRYLYYLIHAFDLKKGFYGMGSGVRQGLNYNEVKELKVVIPDANEQTAITTFLDEQCGKIDSLIAEAKASVEEYKKWKQSIIFEAVTKGLNPDVEMKDSGIEWIGRIPTHWKLSSIKSLYDVTLGKMLTPKQENDSQTLETYLCASNIKWMGVDTSVARKMWFSEKEKSLYLLEVGDALIMEGGSVGTSCIYTGEFSPCFIQNSVHRCRGRNGNESRFLVYWMNIVVNCGYVDSICNKATIKHYTKEKVLDTPFLVIPVNEQKLIIDYLDDKCGKIDSLISGKQTLLSDLETYKRSLIYETVTGKRKVV